MRKLRRAQMYPLHRLTMMSSARDGGLDPLSKIILRAADHNGCVVDSVNLGSCQGDRVLKSHVRMTGLIFSRVGSLPFAQDPSLLLVIVDIMMDRTLTLERS